MSIDLCLSQSLHDCCKMMIFPTLTFPYSKSWTVEITKLALYLLPKPAQGNLLHESYISYSALDCDYRYLINFYLDNKDIPWSLITRSMEASQFQCCLIQEFSDVIKDPGFSHFYALPSYMCSNVTLFFYSIYFLKLKHYRRDCPPYEDTWIHEACSFFLK